MSMGLFSIYSKLGNILIKRKGSVTPVDKSELEELILLTNNDVGPEEDYTPNSWAPFAISRTAAENIFDDPDATQMDVDAAVSNLESAYLDLVPVADRNDLTNLITYIGINIGPEEDYTPETWAPFAAALSDGISIRDDMNATQQQVDDIVDVLNNAMIALETVE